MTLRRAAETMKAGWNERARRDAFQYVEATHWDGDVDAFFALGEQRARLLIDPVAPLLTRPPAESVALDLGCGVGRISRALASRFREVVGVDVSEEMVGRARDLHPRDRFPNLRFQVTDGLALPLAPASVDFAFSYEVFQHMPSHDVIVRNLDELRRVLRPGGTALVHVHTERPEGAPRLRSLAYRLPPRLLRAVKLRLLRHDPMTADEAYRGAPPLRLADVRPLFAEAGFDVVELRGDPTHPPGTRAFVVARQRLPREASTSA